MQLSQKASIPVDGANSRVFTGHVNRVNSKAEFLHRNVQTLNDREHQAFGVKIFIDDTGGVLKSGMSATLEGVRPVGASQG